MKKIILSILLLLAAAPAMAQFVMVEGGFSTENKKGYMVVKHEGPKDELYEKVKNRLFTMYANPDKVMSCSGDIISINAATSGISFVLDNSLRTMLPVFRFKMNIYFKDNRVRFDAPVILGDILDDAYPGKVYYHLGRGGGIKMFQQDYYFYDKEGKVRQENANEAVEAYFNGFVVDIMTNLEKDGSTEDW